MKKAVKYVLISLAGLFVIGLIKSIITGKKLESQNEKTVTEESYKYYRSWSNEAISLLDNAEKKKRDEFISELKSTKTYTELVNQKTVSVDYIPIFNAIANGITYLNSKGGFSVEDEIMTRVEQLKNGEDKAKFVVNTLLLAQTSKGGIPLELLPVFDLYKAKYKLYGEPSVYYDAKGTEKEKNQYNYDFTPIFSILDHQNKETLNAVLEAKQKGISKWRKDEGLEFPYLSNSAEYTKRLLTINPDSELLPKNSNDKFWKDYAPEVRVRIIEKVLLKDCEALQNEFSIADQNNASQIARTGTGNTELMNFIDENLREIGCYK